MAKNILPIIALLLSTIVYCQIDKSILKEQEIIFDSLFVRHYILPLNIKCTIHLETETLNEKYSIIRLAQNHFTPLNKAANFKKNGFEIFSYVRSKNEINNAFLIADCPYNDFLITRYEGTIVRIEEIKRMKNK